MENIEQPEEQNYHEPSAILPKPVLVEDRQNWVRKSLISLGIYAFLFLIIFDFNVVYIAAILVVLLIHEFGHFFAMKFFNYSNVKLFVLPLLGAYVTGKKSVVSQRQMSIIILAGPLPGIIIGFALFFLNQYYMNEKVSVLSSIFIILNVFNLLPFLPLDGGKLLETLFVGQNFILRIVFSIISIIALLSIAIINQNIIFLIIPGSMIFGLVSEFRNEKIRKYLKQENINYVTDYDDLPDFNYWAIRDCILLAFHKRYAGIKAGVHKYSIIESNILKHVISILKTPFNLDVKILEKIAILLTYLAFLVIPIIFYVLLYIIKS